MKALEPKLCTNRKKNKNYPRSLSHILQKSQYPMFASNVAKDKDENRNLSQHVSSACAWIYQQRGSSSDKFYKVGILLLQVKVRNAHCPLQLKVMSSFESAICTCNLKGVNPLIHGSLVMQPTVYAERSDGSHCSIWCDLVHGKQACENAFLANAIAINNNALVFTSRGLCFFSAFLK